MEANRRVVVNANGTSLTIKVMKGKQTFKWLALVLQERLKQIETSIRGPKTETGCLVTGLLNNDGELLDPRDQICEHALWVDDEWHITAQTASTFPSDVWGNPIYNEWVSAAYLNSEINFRWMLEMESWRLRLEPGQITNGPDSAGSSNLIQIGDAPDVETAFELDWSSMHWKWLSSLTEINKTALRATLGERYELMLAIFRHYCGAGELGQRYGMTTMEFQHMVRMALYSTGANEQEVEAEAPSSPIGGAESKAQSEAAPTKKVVAHVDVPAEEEETIEQLIALLQITYEKTAPVATVTVSEAASAPAPDSKYNSTKSKAQWQLMSRAHMVQAFICLAVEKEMGPSIVDAVINFIDGPLLQLWRRIINGYTLYRYLDDSTFVEAFISTYQVLKQSFMSFGSIHPQKGPTMSVDKCVWLFKESLFVGSTLGEIEQEGACVSSILASMLIDPGLASSKSSKRDVKTIGNDIVEFNEIVFVEFLEALTSVALVAEHDSGMEVGKKIRLAFNTLVQLQPPPPEQSAEIGSSSSFSLRK